MKPACQLEQYYSDLMKTIHELVEGGNESLVDGFVEDLNTLMEAV